MIAPQSTSPRILKFTRSQKIQQFPYVFPDLAILKWVRLLTSSLEMKAIRDESVLAGIARALLLLAVIPFFNTPAYGKELKAEPIFERCKAKLASQEAVLHKVDDNDQFVVIAARNPSLEGEIVTLKHIFGAVESERVYLYYKPGSRKPVLKLPYLEDDLSQAEDMTIRRYYAAKGKITISFSNRSQKVFHPKASKKARAK